MKILVSCAFIIFAQPGLAALLRSGEHGEYTRLAFTQNALINWSIEQEENIIVVRFSPEPELDLTQAFSRIGRDRISEVQYLDGALRLLLSCDCAANISRVPPDQIAIDISENFFSATVGEADSLPGLNSKQMAQDLRSIDRPEIPLVLPPVSARLSREITIAADEAIIAPRRTAPMEASPINEINQIAVRDGRALSTKREDPDPIFVEPEETGCEEFEVLDTVLFQDDLEAFDEIAPMIEGLNLESRSSVTALITAYAKAGLLTEARHLSEATGIGLQWVSLLYAASSETDYGNVTIPDYTRCGAQVSLLYLASGGLVETLPADLRTELIALSQTLPDRHRWGILKRAVINAKKQGLSQFSEELDAWTLENPNSEPTQALVRYAEEIAGLMRIPSQEGHSDELLQQSQAIERELPAGEVRHTLRLAKVRDAVKIGDFARTKELLDQFTETGRKDAIEELALVITDASVERTVILASIFSSLADELPDRASDIIAVRMRNAGYPQLAGRWERGRPPPENRLLTSSDAELDFTDASGAGSNFTDAQSPDQNVVGEYPPVNTFEGAMARLSRSRDVQSSSAALLENGRIQIPR